MRNWIQALTLMLALSAAVPSMASTISITGADGPFALPPAGVIPMTGADGRLAPATDYTLPYRADGLFDFTSIDLGTGITLRFDPQTRNVKLSSLGDILIAGTIDASGIQLALETPGRMVITGSISAGSISLADTGTLADDPLRIGSGGSILLSSGPGGGLSPTRFSVPEPATRWLILTLLPILILLGRKSASHGC